jgi:hypothetical protein
VDVNCTLKSRGIVAYELQIKDAQSAVPEGPRLILVENRFAVEEMPSRLGFELGGARAHRHVTGNRDDIEKKVIFDCLC